MTTIHHQYQQLFSRIHRIETQLQKLQSQQHASATDNPTHVPALLTNTIASVKDLKQAMILLQQKLVTLNSANE